MNSYLEVGMSNISFDTAENEQFKVFYKDLTRYTDNDWISYLEPKNID